MIRNILILLVAIVSFVGCELDVPDLNNPGEGELRDNPSPELVAAAATGLLVGSRAGYAENNGYIAHLSVIGREAYNFDTADPRFRSELLSSDLNGGSPAFGGNLWVNPYANIHVAKLLLETLERNESTLAASFDMSEMEAIRGYTKTIMALDYLNVINTRDDNGAALVSGTEIDDVPPLVAKADIFAEIEKLLDEGRDHLNGASEGFPFALSSGFAGFDAPSTFIGFNRALKARTEVYQGKYEAALTSLEGSFLTVDASAPQFDLGTYHSYGNGSGDTLNELVSINIFAHPSITADAAAGDARIASKTVLVDETTVDELTSTVRFTSYAQTTSPAPIIRNEELILLRAEARFESGDLAGAIQDVNFVRVHAAELTARSDLTQENFFEELIYQRRYSLLFEGHRWIDMRRWGRLDELPVDREQDGIPTAFPIPTTETDARQ